MVPTLQAKASSTEVKGYIPLDFDDAIVQKHLLTEHVVGLNKGKAYMGKKYNQLPWKRCSFS